MGLLTKRDRQVVIYCEVLSIFKSLYHYQNKTCI